MTEQHDLRLVALAFLLCGFASFTALTLLQRGIFVRRRWRTLWLAGAGVITGIGIWGTHFTAMIAYRPGFNVHIDLRVALASIVVAILFAIGGWAIGFGARRRLPLVGGAVVGLGLTLAHYLDISAMTAGGIIVYDHATVALSIVLGIALSALASWLIFTRPSNRFPILASATLSAAIILLHFVGMTALTIIPGAAPAAVSTLDLDWLGALIIVATVGILAVALAITIHDQRLARRTSADRDSLEHALWALRDSEERYRLASSATKDVIWEWHHDTDRVEWGDAMEAQFGYPEAKSGTSLQWWLDRLFPGDAERLSIDLNQALDGGATNWGGYYRFRRADGSYADIHSRCHIVRNGEGKAIRSVGAMLDISESKRTEDDLRWAASHDPLTQLANRNLFTEQLSAALADAKRTGTQVGLVLLDIDDFKVVNDTLGHATGDALLLNMAARLRVAAGLSGQLARLGGDEFAIIFPQLSAADATDSALVAALAALGETFVVDGRVLNCSVSIGAALGPRDGTSTSALLKSADLALYSAKSEGRGLMRLYASEMSETLEKRVTMLSDARSALDDDRIVPFYQPKIALGTGELVGFEALLRWHHHRKGLQSPNTIEAAFDDTDVSSRLTARMIDRVIIDVRHWLQAGVDFRRMAINGSAVDFIRGDFAERFLETLHRADIPPERFELEVTESVFVERGSSRIERILEVLSNAGVTIALDDFGTGYASLSHLKQFPVDVLKIDQSFVKKLDGSDDDNAAIVRAVIGLGHSLRLTTVAEGVETEQQAKWLLEHGCDVGQGYLFSRAVSAARVPGLIRSFADRGGIQADRRSTRRELQSG